MNKKKRFLYSIFFILLISISMFLFACNKGTSTQKDLLLLKTDVSQLTFIEDEVHLDEIAFEYIDINGNVIELNGNDLEISETDRESLNTPGFKSITFKYNNSEHIVCFLVQEKPTIYNYNLTFDANGGFFSTINAETLSITSGEILRSPPETPVREGYDFSGWYPNYHFIESDKLITPYKISPEVTSFVAKWLSTKRHEVSYKKQQGEQISNIKKIDNMTISDGESIHLINKNEFQDYDILIKNNSVDEYLKYNFVGYKIETFDESTGENVVKFLPSNHTDAIEISNKTTIILVFEINKYDVTFTDDNNVELKKIKVEYGKKVNTEDIPEKPSITGYETYWFNKTLNKDYRVEDIENVTRNISIQLKKTIIRITVNFYDEDNIKLTNISNVYEYGKSIGANKTVPHKNGYDGKWRFNVNDIDTFYEPVQLQNLILNIALYPQIESSKQISFYATYTKKRYTLRFHYDLPEQEGLIFEKEIEYGDRINAKDTMNSNLFALKYVGASGQYFSGYDFSLYKNSTWHYSIDKTNPSTIVNDNHSFDDQNAILNQNPPWDRSVYDFYFNPIKEFNESNISFSYPDPENFDVLLLASDDIIKVEISNSLVKILNTSKLMEYYPRHTIDKWAYNETVDIDDNKLIYQSYKNNYKYFRDDVVYYDAKFYKLSSDESINNAPGVDDSWEILSGIKTKQVEISSDDLYKFNLNEKHLFSENPLINNSIYPIFKERKFSLQIYDQTFQTTPIATNGRYIYSYEFIKKYENLDYTYDDEINFNSLINQYLSSQEYSDGTVSNFELMGLFEDKAFQSVSYNRTSSINIKTDIKLYAKWIDLNFGSDGLVFSKIDNETAALIDFEPQINTLNTKINLNLVIPNFWQETKVKVIKQNALKNLIKYSNIEIENFTLPEFLSEIENDELKNIKVNNSILIANTNTKFNVENNILYENIEGGQRNIVKVPINIDIMGNIAQVFSNVYSINSYAFANFKNILTLTTSDHPSLKFIDNFAFFASSISEFSLGENITYLGYHAFANCENLDQVESVMFSDKIDFGANVFENTKWLIRERASHKQIIIGNILVESIINSTDTTIEIDDKVSIIADNAFVFNVQDNQPFNDITIKFRESSNIHSFGNNVFTNTIKKLIILNDDDIILTETSLNNVLLLETKQSRVEYFNMQLANLENSTLPIVGV